LGFAVEVSRLADASLAADLGHGHSIGTLFNNERLLGVRKRCSLHRSPLLQAGKSPRKTLAKNIQFRLRAIAATILIVALLPSLEKSTVEGLALPPESGNLIYGMY
jgi:hypothetical protein